MDPLLVKLHALRHRPDGIHVQPGVGLVQDRQLRLQHQHLQDLRLLLFAAGEAHVQIPLGIGLVHIQKLHRFIQLFLKIPQTEPLSCLLLQRTADKGTQGHAGHLQRVLEGKKNALFRPLVDRKVGDVLPLEKDLSRGDDIRRVSGDSVAESGFSGTVWAH